MTSPKKKWQVKKKTSKKNGRKRRCRITGRRWKEGCDDNKIRQWFTISEGLLLDMCCASVSKVIPYPIKYDMCLFCFSRLISLEFSLQRKACLPAMSQCFPFSHIKAMIITAWQTQNDISCMEKRSDKYLGSTFPIHACISF